MNHRLLIPLLAALGGCAVQADPQSPATGSDDPDARSCPTEAVDENLARIDALAIVDVGDLIVQEPRSATACYGVPCPGTEAEVAQDETDARCDAADRLDHLRVVADAVATTDITASQAYDPAMVQDLLDRLAGLEVVEVGSFVAVEPVNSGHCYGPCPDAIATAAEINAAQQAKLVALVEGAEQVCGDTPSY